MRAIWGWMAGKKTYLASAAFAVVILVLIFMGRMTPETAISLALFMIPVFASTFRSALANHPGQVANVLDDVAIAGAAYRAHNTPAVLRAVEQIATDLIPAPASPVSGGSPVLGPAAPLSVTFSGPAHEVVGAVSALQAAKVVVQGAE